MPPLKRSFTTFDIRKYIELQIDCLKDWMKRGYIQPSIQKASGRGTKNLFSLNDLYLIALFQYVVRNRRLSRDDAAIKIKIIRELHEIAIDSDKITNKLARLGVADIKHKFEKLEKIDYIFFYQVDDEDKAAAIYNIPPVDVFIADGQTDTDTSKLKDFLDRYEGCDDILAVNFKKIRENIDILLN